MLLFDRKSVFLFVFLTTARCLYYKSV
uniref:Uncharacterized protein n=1 Tax=Anguilla anguilla TaxID=7936 RepID=A0A0E9WKK9_ANGAN